MTARLLGRPIARFATGVPKLSASQDCTSFQVDRQNG